MITLPRSLRERRVFVDSSAYLALLDRKDEKHIDATGLVNQLADHRYRQLTTNILLVEAHALILSNLGIAPATRFLRNMGQSKTIIVRARASDEERAKQILFGYTDKDFSFADAISFAVMERFDVTLAFTFDSHFSQYGFVVVNPRNF
ncbi:MAG: PIN domain-containing protein [Dehalococcoidia bacterium]|nr:PIN domain-containing protein [Dehalococcoidia bacterium]